MNSSFARRIRAALRFVAAISCSASVLPAAAQSASYPDKPVTVVVSFAPGGMTDMVGRMLAAELAKTFKQPFVVENKPGAAGQIGTEYVARRPNDGYTLLISATGHVIGPAVQKSVRYHPVKDFEPIALLAKAPNMLVVHPSVPAKSLDEFVKWAKTQRSVPYGSAGAGGSTHLAGELFRHVSGVPLTHVPYRGASPATNDVVGGQIPMAFQDSMSVSAFVNAGKLRPLAVTSKERSKLFPDLPSISESGYKDFDTYTWLGLYAPAGTSGDITEKLNKEVNRIMSSPEMIAKLKGQSSEAGGDLTPGEFKKYVETEVAKWQSMVKVTGVKVEQ